MCRYMFKIKYMHIYMRYNVYDIFTKGKFSIGEGLTLLITVTYINKSLQSQKCSHDLIDIYYIIILNCSQIYHSGLY